VDELKFVWLFCGYREREAQIQISDSPVLILGGKSKLRRESADPHTALRVGIVARGTEREARSLLYVRKIRPGRFWAPNHCPLAAPLKGCLRSNGPLRPETSPHPTHVSDVRMPGYSAGGSILRPSTFPPSPKAAYTAVPFGHLWNTS
jgi:hypothetical protein